MNRDLFGELDKLSVMTQAAGELTDAELYSLADMYGMRYRSPDEENVSFEKSHLLQFARMVITMAAARREAL